MVYQLIEVIYAALSSAFLFADQIFDAVGIAFVTAVTLMVLVSAVLRLFTARFIGSQINIYRDKQAATESRNAREAARRDKANAEKLRIQSGKEVL